MKKPKKPKNEEERLAALRDLSILDTPPEEHYDHITELAAYICKVPTALISLVDEERQWFKSKEGTELCESPREISFCAHTILQKDEIMEIPDARKDSRFKGNPLTTDEENPVIFYAGYPLKSPNGEVLGTLCLMDHRPHKLNKKQRKYLTTLGNQVERLFELRLINNRLRKSEGDFRKHNELLKNFAGAVSHDLKMPLANIIMTIDVIKNKYSTNLDETGINYLNRLKHSAFGMSDYISNILEYYETENISSKDYSEQPFGLKEFLEDIIDMLNIETDCEINLPDHNFDLVCNRSGLEQIFLNLLGNSLKYNDKEKTVIDITCQKKGKYYAFSLTDNGMGIPEDKIDKIFDLFTTAIEKDRYGKKGGGIGLSTAQKLVHKLGGEIEVSSVLGKYTCFTFTIEKQKSTVQKTA